MHIGWTLRIKDFVSSNQQKQIVDWAYGYRSRPEALVEIRSKISALFPNAISMTNPTLNFRSKGTGTSIHKDESRVGCYHVRCNYVVKSPISGGVLVIEGKEHYMEERELFCFVACRDAHELTPVGSDRIMITCGVITPKIIKLL